MVVGYWLLVICYWLLVICCWLFVIGYWLFVIGYWLLVFSSQSPYTYLCIMFLTSSIFGLGCELF
ncbi:hypothetical protein [Microcoleus anatoxicus]|uniref:NADH dehydrogenase subunit 4L n=1 Tax=Microcoleus anatoxicus PTRS2 TaxID=2705321 RepID=A0ABU8YGS8_9CYAN